MQKNDVRNEVWMWVHQKYRMSRVEQKLYPLKAKNWSYLSVLEKNLTNPQKNETYNMPCTNG